jgi:hypothetical protein
MRSLTGGRNVPKETKTEPDDAEQSQRFIETAQLLEADKNPEAFERALNILSEKPTPPAKPKP